MPLIITIGTPELASNTRIVGKRAHTTPYVLTVSHYINRTTPLDKDSINIRGIVSSNLSGRDSASYESNILT